MWCKRCGGDTIKAELRQSPVASHDELKAWARRQKRLLRSGQIRRSRPLAREQRTTVNLCTRCGRMDRLDVETGRLVVLSPGKLVG